MSEQRKYIGKKRKKIFSIEKCNSQLTPKNEILEKVNLSPIEEIFPSEEIQTYNPHKLYLNLNEIKEKNGGETQKHSLINISKLVFEFLKAVGHTTGNEVTSHIKNVIYSKNNSQPNQKNIQRRVYDAINVMCAAGLIRKNRQEIQFIRRTDQENHNHGANDETNSNEKKEEEKSDEIEEKIKAKINELEDKRKKLIKNYLTMKFYEKYYKLNDAYPQRKFQKKLEFPFDLIKYDSSSPIKITSKDDASRYLLLSNSELVHLTPYDIIKKFISPDILLKLNESMNNTIENKSNRKKSTNDNSFAEEANNNIDNNSLINMDREENKVEESPKKNKLFPEVYAPLNYIIPKETSQKRRKDEKDDDLVFDYLKNVKSFVEEIISSNAKQIEVNNVENNDVNIEQEEPENIFGEENEIFTKNKLRKNSNLSNWSNLYDENEIKKNKDDLRSEIELFMQNFK